MLTFMVHSRRVRTVLDVLFQGCYWGQFSRTQMKTNNSLWWTTNMSGILAQRSQFCKNHYHENCEESTIILSPQHTSELWPVVFMISTGRRHKLVRLENYVLSTTWWCFVCSHRLCHIAEMTSKCGQLSSVYLGVFCLTMRTLVCSPIQLSRISPVGWATLPSP